MSNDIVRTGNSQESAMFIQINQELCTGCGACEDACSVGAIHLVDGRAEIDDALCIVCEACVEACPNMAIAARYTLDPIVNNLKLPAAETRPIPVRDQIGLTKTKAAGRGWAPLAGTALAFLGHEVAPRLVDVLISAFERRLAQSTTKTVAPLSTSSRIKCQRRQSRYRGGQLGIRNFKVRR
jgi:ferredoxin